MEFVAKRFSKSCSIQICCTVNISFKVLKLEKLFSFHTSLKQTCAFWRHYRRERAVPWMWPTSSHWEKKFKYIL